MRVCRLFDCGWRLKFRAVLKSSMSNSSYISELGARVSINTFTGASKAFELGDSQHAFIYTSFVNLYIILVPSTVATFLIRICIVALWDGRIIGVKIFTWDRELAERGVEALPE